MSHFCLLKDPDGYVPQMVDLAGEEAARGHWLDLFARQFEQMLSHAAACHGRSASKRVAAAREEFLGLLDRLRGDPSTRRDAARERRFRHRPRRGTRPTCTPTRRFVR